MPETEFVEQALMCDQPFCDAPARWFVGARLQEDINRGHAACSEHLHEAAVVTLKQLASEDYRKGMLLIPVVRPGVRVWP